MSKLFPECPLYSHDNCKHFKNEKICAMFRKDKTCQKKKNNSQDRAHHKKKENPIEHPIDVHSAPLGRRKAGQS